MTATFLRQRGIRLLSFDLDDTLLDTDATTPYRIEAAASEARRLVAGLDVARAEEALRRAMAENPVTEGTVVVFIEALGLDLADETGVAIRRAYNEVVLDTLEWVPGAQDALVRLREGYRLAVVTNGPATMQWPKVRRFGLEALVDHIVVSGDVGVRKPDPAIFRHLLGEAGLEAEAAAHVGDSIHSDIAGARAAGLSAIWCPPRLRRPDEVGDDAPDLTIERLADLLT